MLIVVCNSSFVPNRFILNWFRDRFVWFGSGLRTRKRFRLNRFGLPVKSKPNRCRFLTYRFFLGVIRVLFRNITLIFTISVFWEYTRKNVQQERKVRDKIDVE